MGKGPRIDCSKDVPITQQSGKDECDINVIVERAKRGAVMEPRVEAAMYGDFTQVPTDLRDALNKIRFADELFMSMDPVVRRRFDNDPAKLLDFILVPANREEAINLGLVKAPVGRLVDVSVETLATLRSIDKGLKESSGAKSPKRSDGE